MNDLGPEKSFFEYIVPKIRTLVSSFGKDISISVQKDISSDFATVIDIAVEQLIVEEIQKRFPNDQILAEEGHSETTISDSRIWIIDPICGTNNLSRGMNTYCTNIALANNNNIVAACVIDHGQDDYFWSIGENKVYVNDKLAKRQNDDRGINVDIDLGSLPKVSNEQRDKHLKAISHLLENTDYMLLSLNSSLGFAYVAVGKVDGFIWAFNHPWDVCAGSFLIQQSGGIITNLDGSEWRLDSIGCIAAKNDSVHRTLLNAYLQ